MKLFIFGAGGHAKVAIDILGNFNEIVCIVDDNEKLKGSFVLGVPVMDSTHLKELKNNKINKCFVAIGNNDTREKIINRLSPDFDFVNAQHLSSCVSEHAIIGKGVLINAGAIVNAGSIIKDHSIINTSATVDHDCTIEEYVHICPGVNLAGNVSIGKKSTIGIGSVVLPNIFIGENTTIGALSCVVKNIESNKVAYGHPCKVSGELLV